MSSTKFIAEGVHAVMAVDPGRTTGLVAGYVELKPTLKETLATLDRRKATEVSGDWLLQARDIATKLSRFVYTANVEQSMPLDRVHVVFEDFVLRRRMAGGATGDLTSIWVAAAAVVGLEGVEVRWQQASNAKTLATNERLKLWGLWEVGSPHERDAWRHFALRVNKLIDE